MRGGRGAVVALAGQEPVRIGARIDPEELILLVAAAVLAVMAAEVHILIFYMESIAWEGALARKTFGGTPEEARPHAFYAYNQGFYNLFLAIQTVVGVVLMRLGVTHAGAALILAGTGSMLAAALVLFTVSPSTVPRRSSRAPSRFWRSSAW